MSVTALGRFRAVFLGAPGAGKGTQAKQLVGSQSVLHISTGDMLREHVGQDTELGRKAKSYMDSGQLVPDDLIIAMVQDRLDRPDADQSWILDGFPRTVPQAMALDSCLGEERGLSHVLYFRVPSEKLVERLAGRQTCSSCGAIWNRFSKPTQQEGVCDLCGGTLTQREDDKPEAVTKRLEVYTAQTEPLLAHYRDQGVLVEIDADRSSELVFEELLNALSQDA